MIEVKNLEQVKAKILALGDPRRTAQAYKAAGVEALQPALRMAKHRAPKKKGLLAESLGITTAKNGTDLIFRLEPRRSFRGDTTAVGDSDKSRAAHKKSGLTVHKGVPPAFYAIIVATGRLPIGDPRTRSTNVQLGRKVRAANPFFNDTYAQTNAKVPDHYANALDRIHKSIIR